MGRVYCFAGFAENCADHLRFYRQDDHLALRPDSRGLGNRAHIIVLLQQRPPGTAGIGDQNLVGLDKPGPCDALDQGFGHQPTADKAKFSGKTHILLLLINQAGLTPRPY